MLDTSPSVTQRIADRIVELRHVRRQSLDSLAAKSGVSRSMISLIERGESNPTAPLLEKLAAALNVPLAALFDGPAKFDPIAKDPLVRRADQSEWKDPSSGYIRRSVSPPGFPQPMQIVEVRFPPGRRVTFDAIPRVVRIYQQIWMLEGEMEVTVGKTRHRMRAGDCLAMELDCPTVFRNPGRKSARYAVVTATQSPERVL